MRKALLMLATVAVTTLVSSCGTDTPTGADALCDAMSIQPQIIHMRVGEQKEFQAFPIVGSWDYKFLFTRPQAVNLQTVVGRGKVVLTAVNSCGACELSFSVSQCGDRRVFATVFID